MLLSSEQPRQAFGWSALNWGWERLELRPPKPPSVCGATRLIGDTPTLTCASELSRCQGRVRCPSVLVIKALRTLYVAENEVLAGGDQRHGQPDVGEAGFMSVNASFPRVRKMPDVVSGDHRFYRAVALVGTKSVTRVIREAGLRPALFPFVTQENKRLSSQIGEAPTYRLFVLSSRNLETI